MLWHTVQIQQYLSIDMKVPGKGLDQQSCGLGTTHRGPATRPACDLSRFRQEFEVELCHGGAIDGAMQCAQWV